MALRPESRRPRPGSRWKPPFRIEIFKNHEDVTPQVEAREKKGEAQNVACRALRRGASHVYIKDADGHTCWDSHYASSMPVDRPKM